MTEKNAILLLHGYGGSPFEMEFLQKGLQDAGFAAFVPTLPGHNGDFTEFLQTRFCDWLEKCEQEFVCLQKKFPRVAVVGYSMGGTLALHLAARKNWQPSAVVCISAPIDFAVWKIWRQMSRQFIFLSILRWICPVWHTSLPRPQSREIAPWRGYEGKIALQPLYSLVQGVRQTRKMLADMHAPLLVLHGERDRLVAPENAWKILQKSGSKNKRLELLKLKETVTSGHTLPTHRECKELILQRIIDFLQENMK